MIKAISTKYDGHYFRSRLEARWAVFFNTLGVKFEYEKEGFEFENGDKYLPDFWLPLDDEFFPGWGSFVEIKPMWPDESEMSVAQRLSKETGHNVFVFWGELSVDSLRVAIFKGQQGGRLLLSDGRISADDPVRIYGMELPPVFISKDRKIRHQMPFFYRCAVGYHALDGIYDALDAARSARFEFGETPRAAPKPA